MKYFLDTEFIEDSKTIDLISIGIVCENGLSFYRESSEFDPSKACDWVKENVLTRLENDECRATRQEIKEALFAFIETTRADTQPEFWGYYASYDWIVLCQLFGTMMDLPEGYPMFINDIMQLVGKNPDKNNILGVAEAEQKMDGTGHNALFDARWTRETYERLTA